MLLVNAAHERGSGRQDLIDEDEDGFFRAELDALSDDVDKLADGEVGRDQVLLLVDGGDVGLLDFFADYLCEGDNQHIEVFEAFPNLFLDRCRKRLFQRPSKRSKG